jgi:hypothetical protein
LKTQYSINDFDEIDFEVYEYYLKPDIPSRPEKFYYISHRREILRGHDNSIYMHKDGSLWNACGKENFLENIMHTIVLEEHLNINLYL